MSAPTPIALGAERGETRALPSRGDTKQLEQVLALEQVELSARRKARDELNNAARPRPEQGSFGLALSGGGIRSATVSLGFMAGMQRAQQLAVFDYVSSVSGGSYANGYLQVMTSPQWLRGEAREDLYEEAFSDERVELLLDSGRYLATGDGARGFVNVLRLATSYFTSLLLHWSWLLSLAIMLGLSFHCLRDDWLAAMTGLARLAVGSLVARLVIGRDWTRTPAWLRRRALFVDDWLNRFETVAWVLLAVGALGRLLEDVPAWAGSLLSRLYDARGFAWSEASTGMLALAASLAVLSIFARVELRAWLVLTATLLLSAGLGSLDASVDPRLGRRSLDDVLGFSAMPPVGWFALSVLGTLLLTLITSPNATSLHRYYSARLADAFLGRARRQRQPDLVRARSGLLGDLAHGSVGPYPLFNGCLNLIGHADDQFAGDKTSDYFVFSPHHCGSALLGYASTVPGSQYASLTLADAITCSGAAISPFQGRSMPSATSILLWLFNLRTDLWLPNPARPRRWLHWLLGDRTIPWGPVRQLSALAGKADTRSRFVNVSDGAFIDSLGVIELLRRRCRNIVAIDATLDPEYTFHELRNLVLRARQELDVHITFDESPERSIRPALVDGSSKTSLALARIAYPDGTNGSLFYLKSSLPSGVDVCMKDVRKAEQYRVYHPEFPQETTGDQFFDQAQWGAYFALGHALAAQLRTDPAWLSCIIEAPARKAQS